jgi:hypothetical protein
MHEAMRFPQLLMCPALFLALAMSAPATLPAQQAPADSARIAKVDSLEARIRELESRLDSLLAALARGEGQQAAAQQAAAELDALRAAARAAAAEQPQDTTTSQATRGQSLSILNPEISVTGDVLAEYLAPGDGDGQWTAVPREFEFSFQAALDPYTRTKIFATYEEEFEIAGYPEEDGAGDEGPSVPEIEEGYLYWVGLPARLGLKAGKFRQQIGLYNRWHTHALLEVDRPLASVVFLGDDGLIDMGASLNPPVLAAGPSTNTLTFELARASNAALFDDSHGLSFLGNLQSFWDLSPASYLQLQATGVYGENGDAGLTSRLLELDLTYRWRPPGRSKYRDLRLSGEWYFAEKDYGDVVLRGNGGYLQANYRLDLRWIFGLRADYLNSYGDGPELYQLVPTLTWWQSEWVFLRLQYNYLKPASGPSSSTLIFQTVWAAGPHKHETY